MIKAYNTGLKDRYQKEDMIIEYKLLDQDFMTERK